MKWLTSQFELSRGTVGHNVRAMEGMRGFAVFLVFLVHFVTLSSPWIAPGSTVSVIGTAVHAIGNSGVDLFFVLSGYLIYGSLMTRPQPFFAFMRRRVVRIYPTFCAVFAAYLCLSFLFPGESKIPAGNRAAWIYTLQNFALLPGIFPITPMITVAWSLSYEMFFYLAIPAAILLLALRQRSRPWRIRVILALGGGFALYCAVYGGPLRLIMFITGMLLHETLQSGSIVPPRDGFASLALAGALLSTAAPLSFPGAGPVKLLILAAGFYITCYRCFWRQGALARVFSWTPLRWLGNMSYSYYLLHGLALKAAFTLLPHVIPPAAQAAGLIALLLPVMFAVTLIPSIALFILVERPFSLNVSPRPVAAWRRAPRSQ